MLKRPDRIQRKEFSQILLSRRFADAPHFSLRVGEGSGTARAAVSVSKKVAKSAVVRNAIRRRAYASVAEELPLLAPGLYLFRAKSGAEKLRGEALREEISLALKGFRKI